MFENEEVAKKVAASLLQIKAIRLSPQKPFLWASGWKSPIYCDNRLSLSHPSFRTYLKNQFSELIQERFPECNQLAGVATAGIAHGALIADHMDLPFCYIRSKAKAHGRQNQIEGSIIPGAKMVVVEDLISTGGSTLKAVEALREREVEVLGAVAIFTYGFPLAENRFTEAKCEVHTLSNYEAMIPIAREMEYVGEDDLQLLKSWRATPDTWNHEV